MDETRRMESAGWIRKKTERKGNLECPASYEMWIWNEKVRLLYLFLFTNPSRNDSQIQIESDQLIWERFMIRFHWVWLRVRQTGFESASKKTPIIFHRCSEKSKVIREDFHIKAEWEGFNPKKSGYCEKQDKCKKVRGVGFETLPQTV